MWACCNRNLEEAVTHVSTLFNTSNEASRARLKHILDEMNASLQSNQNRSQEGNMHARLPSRKNNHGIRQTRLAPMAYACAIAGIGASLRMRHGHMDQLMLYVV